MKSIPAGQFKAVCLELLDQVKERHQEYVITKRGQPYARLTTVEPRHADPFGFMRRTVIDSGKILEPDDELWGESTSDPLHGG